MPKTAKYVDATTANYTLVASENGIHGAGERRLYLVELNQRGEVTDAIPLRYHSGG